MTSEDGIIDGGIAGMMCCGPCGTAKAKSDGIKRNRCYASCDLDLVRCCSDVSEEKRRPNDDRQVRKKQGADTSDDILFRQPESNYLGECPICLVPLSLDPNHSLMLSCCSKLICIGCACACIRIRYGEVDQMIKKKESSCPFCRQPEPKTDSEIELYRMRRIRTNDPVAMTEAGKRCYHTRDYKGAFDYFTRASGLDDMVAEAHYCLSFMYMDGKGVGRNAMKGLYHLEEAAIGGQPNARHDLGVHEMEQGRIERAAKHFIIASNNGHDRSVKALRELSAKGYVSRKDFVMAVRAYRDAVDATRSPQREAAVEGGAIQILESRRLRFKGK